MKLKKSIFLFLALLFPICIFLFLKFFGKNEFTVPSLYADEYPEGLKECGREIQLPYLIPDSVRSSLGLEQDSLTLLYFGELVGNAAIQLRRVENDFATPVKLHVLPSSTLTRKLKSCIFFLRDPYDVVLLDPAGIIHGQYAAGDREEIDRLLTELSILLKRY